MLHFFLSCNVFRVHVAWQLLRAGTFLVNFGTWILLDCLGWLGVMACRHR